MATRAAAMMLQSVVNVGSISMNDMCIKWKPYHKNCGCTLHNLKDSKCSLNTCFDRRKILFPNHNKKQALAGFDCSGLSISTVSTSSQSSLLSSDSSMGKVDFALEDVADSMVA